LRSLEAISNPHDFTAKQLSGLIHEAFQRAGFVEAMVYCRSAAVKRPHRGFPEDTRPT